MNVNKFFKLSIITLSIGLTACQSTDMIGEIKESEDVIVKENITPLVIDENFVNSEKENILNQDGYISLNNLKNVDPEQKAYVLSDNTVYFDFDSYQITKKSEKIIDKHIDFLTANNMIKVIIEGHTDERGEKSYNLTLGEKRAKTVKDYIILKGISPDRLEVVSYGETKPIDNGTGEESWSKNRRSKIVYN